MQDMRDYGAGDVMFGMRYADVVSRGEAGPTIADLAQISALEEEASPRAAGSRSSGGMV